MVGENVLSTQEILAERVGHTKWNIELNGKFNIMYSKAILTGRNGIQKI